ncbi:ABC transporter [[Bacillus thuringiensis] serovar konkukian]|nr:ABC transporter ATP-binding protein [Bacillus thuringiensis]MED1304277.1 ABC transporter ATP-binding protein [Bacillus pacificus]OUB07941.1 ABC transporter [[Bacillus thuringiensis] serovar konkukian]
MFFEMNNLSFRYKHAKQDVINTLSMSIDKGEIVGILGNSGSGKSTLLRLIAGLEYPSVGSITVAEKTIVDDNLFIAPERRGIGLVFQDYALFPHLTVEKNIKFGLHHLPRSEQQVRMLHMLELIDLKGYEKRYPYELSGGQQQRVALARALAPNPSILLMDEPFSNLDADLKEKIRGELKDILRKENMTCIFVSHDREDVRAVCDRVIEIA